MYNQIYVNDYDESVYRSYLNDMNKLMTLKDAYLNQYTNKSDASMLAFKESLDHYVKSRLLKDPTFINSKEFKNYIYYILTVNNSKRFKLTDNNDIYPELLTNIVFRDDKLRNLIFSKCLLPHQIPGYERLYMSAKKSMDLIFEAMKEGKYLSQEYIDLAGDYIYSSRDLSNNRGGIFAKYILNNCKKYNIKSSSQIVGALLTVLTNNYSLDEEVKSSRFYIAEYDRGNVVNMAHSSGLNRYCVFQKSVIDKLSLSSGKSLLMSRTMKDLDIYWIIFVANHELTHQHQQLDCARGKLTTSGISYAINKALIELMPKGMYKDRTLHDYSVNHDSDEIEMEADEEGWRQARKFIYAFVDKDNRYMTDENGKQVDKWFLAHDNEEVIQVRRTFSVKRTVDSILKKNNSHGMYYAVYDLINLEKGVKANPRILDKYPILKNFFYANGEMRALDILRLDIYKNSQEDFISRNSRNNAGLEIGTYVLNHKWNTVKQEIEQNRIKSRKEIDLIARSIYYIVHESVLKVRNFNRIALDTQKRNMTSIDPKQYSETVTRYNLFNNNKGLYEYYFKCVVIGTQRFYEYREMIRRKYNIVIDDQFIYFSSYVYELYNNLIDKNDPACMNALEQFRLSGDTHLVNMYNTIMATKKVNEGNNKQR